MPHKNTCDETITKTIKQQLEWLFYYWARNMVKFGGTWFYKYYYYKQSGCIHVRRLRWLATTRVFGFKNIIARHYLSESSDTFAIKVYVVDNSNKFLKNKMLWLDPASIDDRPDQKIVFFYDLIYRDMYGNPTAPIYKQGDWRNNIDILYNEAREEDMRIRYG